MRRALIGSTGFVGGNLHAQYQFDALYHSKNIESIRGEQFDEIYCAGAPAAMWIANKNPEEDRANLEALAGAIQSAKAKHVVLISTVAVYRDSHGATEDTATSEGDLLPYGKHRLALEHAIQGSFNTTVLRLPGLFGSGLKKNVIYDFIHNNNLTQIHSEGRHQYYNLKYLSRDIDRARAHSIPILNITSVPLLVAEVAREVFDVDFHNILETTPASFDMRSRHAALWGGSDGYLYSRDSVIHDLRTFVEEVRELSQAEGM